MLYDEFLNSSGVQSFLNSLERSFLKNYNDFSVASYVVWKK